MLGSLTLAINEAAGPQWAGCRLLTLSSGESSAEVDTESEDIAEGGFAWADRSEREVEVLVRDNMMEKNKQKKEILSRV